MKLPSFQFYPADWIKDPNLRRCNHEEKGIWIDMLCLMFECETRGVLTTTGKPWSNDEIVTVLGGDQQRTLAALTGLLDKGVARRNNAGAIYSLRMMRDEEIRKKRVICGSLGGRPTFSNNQNESKTKAKRKQNVTPSSSSSSSSSSSPSTSISPSSSDRMEGGLGETKTTHTKRFQKPTLGEVSIYCMKIDAGIDPQRFLDFYDSKGWVVGRSPMKDWRAAVRTWKRGGSYGSDRDRTGRINVEADKYAAFDSPKSRERTD